MTNIFKKIFFFFFENIVRVFFFFTSILKIQKYLKKYFLIESEILNELPLESNHQGHIFPDLQKSALPQKFPCQLSITGCNKNEKIQGM